MERQKKLNTPAMTAQESLKNLYATRFGSVPAAVIPLAGAGSNRRYFRIVPDDGNNPTAIGTVGTNRAENHAFIELSRHFAEKGLPAPRVLAESDDGMCYIQDDLGDISLFDALKEARTGSSFQGEATALLERTMEMLAHLQHNGADDLDWEVCFPQAAMDSRMVHWDLNYFKYCFLKPAGIAFSEPELENEFDTLHSALMSRAECAREFMVRDFQSRNVMVCSGKPYIIDFQGGRRGPVEYDVASFLWQAKAMYPVELRSHLTETYIKAAKAINPDFNEPSFRQSLPRFVLFRMLQTLGAYGFRGLLEKKAHFLSSIPTALHNLTEHLMSTGLHHEYPYITKLANDALEADSVSAISRQSAIPPFQGLTITVCSFAYKKGIPTDISGNGGGFVFDCRAIHNPGRYEPYKKLTGRDSAVKQFLEDDGEIFQFLNNVWALVDASASRYIKRGFNSLCVNFGCTGGQHRSVYSAEATARHLADRFPEARVVLLHREQNILEILAPGRSAPEPYIPQE